MLLLRKLHALLLVLLLHQLLLLLQNALPQCLHPCGGRMRARRVRRRLKDLVKPQPPWPRRNVG